MGRLVVNPLYAVRERLRRRGLATAGQIAAEEKLLPAVVEEMLAHWQRRGYVEPLTLTAAACASSGTGGCTSSCGGCSVAATAPPRVYRWCGPQAQPPAVPKDPEIALPRSRP